MVESPLRSHRGSHQDECVFSVKFKDLLLFSPPQTLKPAAIKSAKLQPGVCESRMKEVISERTALPLRDKRLNSEAVKHTFVQSNLKKKPFSCLLGPGA